MFGRVALVGDAASYFIEKKGWTASQLLETRITTDEAVEIMRADRR
jgi:hypothetical protein